jgi:hypothetical protein
MMTGADKSLRPARLFSPTARRRRSVIEPTAVEVTAPTALEPPNCAIFASTGKRQSRRCAATNLGCG